MPPEKRVIAIGDIHGCLTAFDLILKQLELTPGDRLVALGDFVDRGPDSRGVLDRLIELNRAGTLIAIFGNHDQMILESRTDPMHDWLKSYGRKTLKSYGLGAGEIDQIHDAH